MMRIKWMLIITLFSTYLYGQTSRNVESSGTATTSKMTPYDFYFLKEDKFLSDSLYNKSKEELTEINVRKFQNDLTFARKCFKEKKFDLAIKTLKVSERSNVVNAEFYFLIGVSCYYNILKKPARRYLIRGYEKLNCIECKEVLKYMNE